MSRQKYYGLDAEYILYDVFRDSEPEVDSKCPSCRTQVSASELVVDSESGVSCPHCGRVVSLMIIGGDTCIMSWVSGVDEGYVTISEVPKLPSDIRDEFVEEYGVSREEAEKLTSDKERARLFRLVSKEVGPELSSTFISDTLAGELHHRDMDFSDYDSEPHEIVELLKLFDQDVITWEVLTEILREHLDEDIPLMDIYDSSEHDKTEEVADICDRVIEQEEKAVKEYMDGDEEVLNYLVGEVMKITEGSADAKETREVFKRKLD